MKGSTPTKDQKAMWDKLAKVGCIACLQDGRFNTHGVIHHIDGRTKPNAHDKVLFLCAPHRQDQGIAGVVAVHPWKARFEREYGSQLQLMADQKLIAGIC